MTATDELRRLLTAAGVEWGNIRNDGSESDYLTEWQFENNQGRAIAIEWAVGSGLSVEIHRYHLTPEQAIAATLGRGTGHDMHEDDGYFKCSECGGRMHGWTEDDSAIWFSRPRFCPNCGRRIVEVDE